MISEPIETAGEEVSFHFKRQIRNTSPVVNTDEVRATAERFRL
jgi:hypothetical protein